MIARRRSPLTTCIIRVVLPLGLALAAAAAAMAYYNWRVFGSPFTMPYRINRQQYSVAPDFLWQHVRPAPQYHHAVMREFYIHIEPEEFQADRSHYWRLFGRKLLTIWMFFLGPALSVPLLAGVAGVWEGRARVQWPAAGFGATLFGITLLAWPTNPHYYAPGTGCLYALLVEGFRRLRIMRSKSARRAGTLAAALALTCVLMLIFRAAGDLLHVKQVNSVTPIPWHAAELFPLSDRDVLIDYLQGLGGRHLVIVRYGPDHSPLIEFVYNRADIDSSEIVWARETGDPALNTSLMDYFKARSIWLFHADDHTLKLLHKPAPESR